MTHPNAHLFAELAERAKTMRNPYAGLQYRVSPGCPWRNWDQSTAAVPPFYRYWQWRFKPEPVTVEAWAILNRQTGKTYGLCVDREEAERRRPPWAVVWPLKGEPYTPEDQQ